MQAHKLGTALGCLPDRPRTLIARDNAVWLWPGVSLTMRHGGAITPVAPQTIRFWIARLHGPEAMRVDVVPAVTRAARMLSFGDELAAQRALDTLGLTTFSPDGAALMRCVAAALCVPTLAMPVSCGPHLCTAHNIALHAMLLQQDAATAAQLAKAGAWDSSKHPKWPAGAPDSQGGRFRPVAASGDSAGSPKSPTELPEIEVPAKPPGIGHNQGPPLEDPPEIPEDEPPADERYGQIKDIGNWMLEALEAGAADAVQRLFAELQIIAWLTRAPYNYYAQLQANLDPPKSLEDLQSAVDNPKPGYQVHHIVEQTQAAQDGFSWWQINNGDNLVLIPTMKHREITTWFQTANDEFGGLSPRDYLRGRSWDERRRVGIGALVRFGVLEP